MKTTSLLEPKRLRGVAVAGIVALAAAVLITRVYEGGSGASAITRSGETTESGLGAKLAEMEARMTAVEQAERTLRRPLISGKVPYSVDEQQEPADDVAQPAPDDEDGSAALYRFETIERSVRNQAIDQEWAAEAESVLVGALGLFERSTLRALDCRTTMCRVEIVHETARDASTMLDELPMRVPFFPRATCRLLTDTDPPRSIYVFARERDTFPSDAELR